ncbi:DoxX family protein [Saccharothrix variisporea]|uniref:DoxX-like protein n=1 Tax=Saccharothrix variisporea TaxID=543527 RepID=A0A495X1Q6_9PSEU|nr:DoxX family protein [Saccharothrix variisporea]RKT68121.1 DoxX-like protein [Saccharothrix variisporea]
MSDQTASVPVKVGNIVVWALQLALAAYFLYSGWLLFGDDFVKKFDEIGFGQWLRYLTGTLEIAGALGLLIPRLCGLAALGLFGVMVGAVTTELFLLDHGDAKLPALLGLVALVIAVLRRDTVKAVVAQVFGK